MSTQLIPFSFESHEIRVASDERGAVWFVAKDVADALDVSWKGSDTLESIKAEWKGVRKFRTPGGEQELIVILEQAVYKLAFRSRKPEAERFSDWAADVIASIHKTGSYVLSAAKAAPSAALDTAMRYAKEGARLARAFGFDRNMIALSANNLARTVTGIDVLEYMGATHLLADPSGRTYTPSELGKLCDPPLSAIKFNLLLESAGLQTKEFGAWMPTDAASGLFEWLDTGKRHSNGAPVKQVKWFSAVLGKMGEQKESAQ